MLPNIVMEQNMYRYLKFNVNVIKQLVTFACLLCVCVP